MDQYCWLFMPYYQPFLGCLSLLWTILEARFCPTVVGWRLPYDSFASDPTIRPSVIWLVDVSSYWLRYPIVEYQLLSFWQDPTTRLQVTQVVGYTPVFALLAIPYGAYLCIRPLVPQCRHHHHCFACLSCSSLGGFGSGARGEGESCGAESTLG